MIGRVSLLCLSVAVAGWQSRADDWPQYLGPGRDATWREENVALDFKKHPPRLLWSKPVGGGYSGPAVAGGRVFVMDRIAEPFKPEKPKPGENINFSRAKIPGRERVLCLDGSTGDPVWEHTYEATYTSAYLYAIGPRCTPLVDDGVVYTLGAEGHLNAYSAEEGEILWKKDFVTDFALEIPEWGIAAHPIVFRHLLICTIGGEGTTVVAFDKKSGEEKWRALSSRKPGYGTPVIETIHRKRQLLVWHGEALNGLDPASGRVLWTAPFKPEFGMAIGAPRVWKDLVYVMGYNGKSGAVRVAPDNRSAEGVWGPDLRLGVAGVMNTAHLRDGHIYSAGRRSMFRCVEVETGLRVWEVPEPLLKADGGGRGAWPSAFTVHHEPSNQTLIFNDHGEMITARLTPEGYEEKARTQIIEPTHRVGGRMLVWSHPALADGRVYCRNDKEIRCWDLGR